MGRIEVLFIGWSCVLGVIPRLMRDLPSFFLRRSKPLAGFTNRIRMGDRGSKSAMTIECFITRLPVRLKISEQSPFGGGKRTE